jgi:predicted DCC family thiol-disulfide oxidoreductase YuxK
MTRDPLRPPASPNVFAEGGPVLLYDGTCGFCSASVQFILAHERQHSLRFASLQGAVASSMRAQCAGLGNVDSMVWLEPDIGTPRVWVRSAAALRVARYLAGPWRLTAAGYLIPARARDRLYDLIAKHRHRLIPASATCWAPPAAARARFLD